MTLSISLSKVNARQSTRLCELFLLPFCELAGPAYNHSSHVTDLRFRQKLGRQARAFLGGEWRLCRKFHQLDRDLIKSGVVAIRMQTMRLGVPHTTSTVELTPAGRELAGQVMARDWAASYYEYLKLSGDKAVEGFVYS
jgi:hypothetical protein